MPELASPIAPPAPKPATPVQVAPPVTPVAPVVVQVTPAEVTSPPAKTEPRKSAVDSIGDKIEAAIASEARKKKGGPDPAPKPAEPVIPPAKGEEVSDDAFKATVEKETEKLTNPAEKKAWADLRYSERDLKRQLKTGLPAAKATEFETKIAELTTQLEAAKTSKPADPTEVQTLRDKLAAAEARDAERENDLAVAKVEKTEAFKNSVTKPMTQIEAVVARLAKKYESAPDKLMKALSDTSDSQSDLLVEAASGMNEVDKTTFYQMAPKLVDINEKAEVLRSQAAEALSKLDSKTQGESAAAQTAAKQVREQAHGTKWTELKTLIPDVLTPLEGDAPEVQAWNQAQTDAEKFARELDYSAMKPEVQVELAQRAAAFPLLAGAVQSLNKQLLDRIAIHEADLVELAKFRASVPGADLNPDGSKKSDPAGNEKDWVQRVNLRAQAAGFG